MPLSQAQTKVRKTSGVITSLKRRHCNENTTDEARGNQRINPSNQQGVTQSLLVYIFSNSRHPSIITWLSTHEYCRSCSVPTQLDNMLGFLASCY